MIALLAAGGKELRCLGKKGASSCLSQLISELKRSYGSTLDSQALPNLIEPASDPFLLCFAIAVRAEPGRAQALPSGLPVTFLFNGAFKLWGGCRAFVS